MFKAAVTLMGIGLFCGGILAFTHHYTAQPIQLNREARSLALMRELLGQDFEGNMLVEGSNTKANIRTRGDCEHFLFHSLSTIGYAGPIDVLALWLPQGPTLSLRVLGHQETPGIGDFIDHQRDPWITQFDHSPAGRFADINNISGATITTTAIKQAAAVAFAYSEVYCGA